jgi:hypothetical protein
MGGETNAMYVYMYLYVSRFETKHEDGQHIGGYRPYGAVLGLMRMKVVYNITKFRKVVVSGPRRFIITACAVRRYFQPLQKKN